MRERRPPEHAARGEHPPPPASIFLRGLTLGALVGAAVAGSVLIGRRRGRREEGDSIGTSEPARG
jgi:hypothetical protein